MSEPAPDPKTLVRIYIPARYLYPCDKCGQPLLNTAWMSLDKTIGPCHKRCPRPAAPLAPNDGYSFIGGQHANHPDGRGSSPAPVRDPVRERGLAGEPGGLGGDRPDAPGALRAAPDATVENASPAGQPVRDEDLAETVIDHRYFCASIGPHGRPCDCGRADRVRALVAIFVAIRHAAASTGALAEATRAVAELRRQLSNKDADLADAHRIERAAREALDHERALHTERLTALLDAERENTALRARLGALEVEAARRNGPVH